MKFIIKRTSWKIIGIEGKANKNLHIIYPVEFVTININPKRYPINIPNPTKSWVETP